MLLIYLVKKSKAESIKKWFSCLRTKERKSRSNEYENILRIYIPTFYLLCDVNSASQRPTTSVLESWLLHDVNKRFTGQYQFLFIGCILIDATCLAKNGWLYIIQLNGSAKVAGQKPLGDIVMAWPSHFLSPKFFGPYAHPHYTIKEINSFLYRKQR